VSQTIFAVTSNIEKTDRKIAKEKMCMGQRLRAKSMRVHLAGGHKNQPIQDD
jgi:hypothetical protein